jgi:F-type H+-transporting ATPase subunit gamma
MPSLRDFRDRIKSVKSTKKITAAMKMVAASKLRRAQEQAQAARPYAQSMMSVLKRVAANMDGQGNSKLMTGTGSDQRHLLVVVTADRGLCGGFNANLIKEARRTAYGLRKDGKTVSIVCVGRKGYDAFQSDLKTLIEKSFKEITSKKRIEYVDAQDIRDYIVSQFEAGTFDVCSLIYNGFQSVMVQTPTVQQLIPFDLESVLGDASVDGGADAVKDGALVSPYIFEPSEEQILEALLPRNIGVQIYSALLDSAAGEQAARMTAMDNATRNAGDMINDLSLQYNRARQAYITKELIEIISGAEAV